MFPPSLRKLTLWICTSSRADRAATPTQLVACPSRREIYARMDSIPCLLSRIDRLHSSVSAGAVLLRCMMASTYNLYAFDVGRRPADV